MYLLPDSVVARGRCARLAGGAAGAIRLGVV